MFVGPPRVIIQELDGTAAAAAAAATAAACVVHLHSEQPGTSSSSSSSSLNSTQIRLFVAKMREERIRAADASISQSLFQVSSRRRRIVVEVVTVTLLATAR